MNQKKVGEKNLIETIKYLEKISFLYNNNYMKNNFNNNIYNINNPFLYNYNTNNILNNLLLNDFLNFQCGNILLNDYFTIINNQNNFFNSLSILNSLTPSLLDQNNNINLNNNNNIINSDNTNNINIFNNFNNINISNN